MADAFKPIFNEDEDSIRARLLAGVPAALATNEGTYARDMLELGVLEFGRLWDELNFLASQTFPQWATGDLLDAHAASFGLARGTGAAASGSVRFTGSPGILIPPGVVLGVPNSDPTVSRVEFLTQNTTTVAIPAAGWVDIAVTATEVGTDGNVNANAITAITGTQQVVGLTSLGNPAPTSGGEDPETDDLLRYRVDAEAALSTGAGTQLDYDRWGREVAGVSEVAVEAIWDRSSVSPPGTAVNGTVKLSLRGPAFVPVSWDTVQAAQVHLDPNRQMISFFEENEGWAVTTGAATEAWVTTAGQVQSGYSAYSLTSTGAGTTVVTLIRNLDLSRFVDDDLFYFWVYSADWTKLTNTSKVTFFVDGSNYYSAAQTVVDGTARPTSSSGWWLWQVKKSHFTATGTPDWSAITSVAVTLDRSASVQTTLDYWTVRSAVGSAGRGRAPIGAAVTVVTPVLKPISVAATLVLADGYALTDALGATNVKTLVQQGLQDYLASVRPGQPVRFAGVANVLHDTPGIVDFSGLAVASGAVTADAYGETIPVTMHEYATLNTLSLS